VQEGNRLHYLARVDQHRQQFSDIEDAGSWIKTFPHFYPPDGIDANTGELSPHHALYVTLYHNDLTCEADTLGSCGYVYIAIYPTQR
jgi:cytoskeleton bundling-enhancing protein CbeA-like protein